MAFDFDVEVRPIRSSTGSTVAFAKLIIDGEILVDGFRIINGSKGLFVGAPNHKGKDKEGKDTWFDDVRFIGTKGDDEYQTPVQKQIYDLMISKYHEVSATNNRNSAASAQAKSHSQTQHKLWPT